MLLEEFLQPLEVTQHRPGVAIRVPPRRINEILRGKSRITADTAVRLSRYFGTTNRFWLNLQIRSDLEVESITLAQRWTRSVPLECVILELNRSASRPGRRGDFRELPRVRRTPAHWM